MVVVVVVVIVVSLSQPRRLYAVRQCARRAPTSCKRKCKGLLAFGQRVEPETGKEKEMGEMIGLAVQISTFSFVSSGHRRCFIYVWKGVRRRVIIVARPE